jgi:hypothetical protein
VSAVRRAAQLWRRAPAAVAYISAVLQRPLTWRPLMCGGALSATLRFAPKLVSASPASHRLQHRLPLSPSPNRHARHQHHARLADRCSPLPRAPRFPLLSAAAGARRPQLAASRKRRPRLVIPVAHQPGARSAPLAAWPPSGHPTPHHRRRGRRCARGAPLAAPQFCLIKSRCRAPPCRLCRLRIAPPTPPQLLTSIIAL